MSRTTLIIQNDIGNRYSPTTIVAVLTEFSEKKASYPICVAVGKDQGLQKDSVVNLSQIRTIDKRRIVPGRIALLSSEIMKSVDGALKNSLAL